MITDTPTIEYLYTPQPNQTDSMFHCWSHGWETLATVTAGERRFAIGVNGEMRLDLPNSEVWRYTDDLTSNKIDTDEKLFIFLSLYPDAMTNNNWFEMYEVGDDSGYSDVYETVDQAIEAVLTLLGETK